MDTSAPSREDRLLWSYVGVVKLAAERGEALVPFCDSSGKHFPLHGSYRL